MKIDTSLHFIALDYTKYFIRIGSIISYRHHHQRQRHASRGPINIVVQIPLNCSRSPHHTSVQIKYITNLYSVQQVCNLKIVKIADLKLHNCKLEIRRIILLENDGISSSDASLSDFFKLKYLNSSSIKKQIKFISNSARLLLQEVHYGQGSCSIQK